MTRGNSFKAIPAFSERMNISRKELQKQYERADKMGWLPHFEEAAKITAGYFDIADLMAIASRETNLDPKWLRHKGDNGHGCGLMQIDDRSFPEFTSSTKWQDARLGILKGAEVLMQKWHDYANNIGKRLTIKGKSFTAKSASGQTAQHIVISSYNCGRWSQYCYAKGIDIDKYSTGHDYGADVMQRASVLRGLISAAGTSQAQTLTGEQKDKVPPNGQESPLVNQTEQAADPLYKNVGLFGVLKKDFAAIGGGNLSFQGLSEYAQQASGWPPWLVGLLTKAAVIAAILSLVWVLYRLIHYLIWKFDLMHQRKVAAPATVQKTSVEVNS